MSLEGTPIRWYYTLDPHVQAYWNELCAAFMKQYGLNVQLDVSLRDLQNTKQKYNESFAEYLTRWREKLGQMRHRPAETYQLIIAMEGCIPVLSKKLGDLGIHNFEELYRFGVQKEFDLAQEKKFFSGRTVNITAAGPSNNVQINAIRPPSSNF